MSKPIMKNVKLPSVDELFTAGATIIETNREGQVQMLPVSELHSFPNHPFLVQNDDKMQETIESIRNKGVLVPILVRARDAGGYEIISGHRRTFACRQLGMETIPALVREMDDDEATIVMVDANIQRERILPSEKAKAYAMKYERLRHQGRFGGNTLEEMAKDASDGAKTIQRYISLASISEELLAMVDKGNLGVTQAFSLTGLSEEEQAMLAEILKQTGKRISVATAEQLRMDSTKGNLSGQRIRELLEGRKEKTDGNLVIPAKTIRHFFSENTSTAYMEQVVLELLRQWKEQRHE